MKRRFSLLLVLSLLTLNTWGAKTVSTSTTPIQIVYPLEGMVLPSIKQEWLIGSVSNPAAHLSINGKSVSVYKTGAFLAWLPVEPGTFTFHAFWQSARSSGTLDRSVYVTPFLGPLPRKPVTIDAASLLPKESADLSGDDWLIVSMRASPSQKAEFSIPGHGWMGMVEREPGSGFYEGAYQVLPGEKMSASPVRFRVGGSFGVSAKSRGKVSFNGTAERVARVKEGETGIFIRTEPGHGDRLKARPGTLFMTKGFIGGQTRVVLDNDLSEWVYTKDIEFLPLGTPPPKAELETIATHVQPDGAKISMTLGEHVPFVIEEDLSRKILLVRIFYAKAHTNWIIYDSSDTMVGQIEEKQSSSQAVDVVIHLKSDQMLWGYHAQFNDSSLEISLRRPPHLAKAPASPLKGLTIFLDPGHMPSAPGAIGPLGTKEMDINFEISEIVGNLLSKEGARVISSREDDNDEVSLNDRPRMAFEEKADLYVSIHNNNLGDGQDPFAEPHGYSVFYYRPRSFALADAIYKSYGKYVKIPGEDMRFGDLYVLRLTEMPAVLTESAYLTFPEQEALLLTPAFRKNIALSIVSGLRSFMSEERVKQGKHR